MLLYNLYELAFGFPLAKLCKYLRAWRFAFENIMKKRDPFCYLIDFQCDSRKGLFEMYNENMPLCQASIAMILSSNSLLLTIDLFFTRVL